MVANGRINSTWDTEFIFINMTNHLFIQGFAHAMQTLKFVLTDVVFFRICHFINRGKGLRIVGRKLWVNQFRCSQELFSTCNIRQICMHFTCENRVVRHAIHLCFFNFAVPISTFYKANHQAFCTAFCKVNDIINHIEATFLIGLDDKTDAFPICQLWFKT